MWDVVYLVFDTLGKIPTCWKMVERVKRACETIQKSAANSWGMRRCCTYMLIGVDLLLDSLLR
jgi:hypothetical protein